MAFGRWKCRGADLFFIPVILAGSIVAGCVGREKVPLQICGGAESVDESLSLLKSRAEGALSLRASGDCLFYYYADGKGHKEHFPIKIWVNPPVEIYLQGDIGFDPKGIMAGCNARSFWFSIKPELSTYQWGLWAEAGRVGQMMLSPRVVLEALGVAAVDGQAVGRDNWSLSNDGAFDILTQRSRDGTAIKSIYIYNCNSTVSRIEYFDSDGKVVVAAKPDDYKQLAGGFSVPRVVKIIHYGQDNSEDWFRVRLNSIKTTTFTKKQRKGLFARPDPRGFEHVYKIIGNDLAEQ